MNVRGETLRYEEASAKDRGARLGIQGSTYELLELVLRRHGAGGDDGGANGRLGRDAAVSGAKGSGAEGDGGGEEGSGHRVALRFAL